MKFTNRVGKVVNGTLHLVKQTVRINNLDLEIHFSPHANLVAVDRPAANLLVTDEGAEKNHNNMISLSKVNYRKAGTQIE